MSRSDAGAAKRDCDHEFRVGIRFLNQRLPGVDRQLRQHAVRGQQPPIVAAGINPRFRFHDQRHTYASILRNGINASTLRDLLGHTSMRQRYARPSNETFAAIRSALG